MNMHNTSKLSDSHIINCPNLNLAQIAASGQCFRMLSVPENPGVWSLISGPYYLEICETPDGFFFDCPNEALSFWKHYFDLETDYAAFIASIRSDDVYLAAAAKAGSGIRILRQDLWEMMITFLISQQKTIPKIREAVESLAKKYGAKRTVSLSDGSVRTYNSFPTPEELSSATLDDLLSLKLGYRAKYIHRLIQDTLSGQVSLSSLMDMTPGEAMTALTSLYGIGPKVANCICLFGLHHIDSFPVDTWIEQILTKEYLPKNPARYSKLPKSRLYGTIIQDFFGCYKGYAGVMQQYIFYYERSVLNGRK